MRYIETRTSTTRGFKWPLDTLSATDLLTDCYKVEVQRRGKQIQEADIHVDEIAKMLTTAEDYRYGVCLCGNVGNGKTTTLKALQCANGYLKERGLISREYGMRIINAVELSAWMRDEDRWHGLKSEPALAIDDVGRESAETKDYGNVLTPFAELIEHRYNNMLFTAISTNLKPSEFEARYGCRVSDRLKEMMLIVTFKRSSFRESVK